MYIVGTKKFYIEETIVSMLEKSILSVKHNSDFF